MAFSWHLDNPWTGNNSWDTNNGESLWELLQIGNSAYTNWQSQKAMLNDSTELKAALEKARMAIDKAQREHDYEHVAELTHGIIPQLEQKIAQAELAENSAGLMASETVSDDEEGSIDFQIWKKIYEQQALDKPKNKIPKE